MRPLPTRRPRTAAAAVLLTVSALGLAIVAPTGAQADPQVGPQAVTAPAAALPADAADPFTGIGLADLDNRTGSLAPTATQQDIAEDLGAHVVWNRFGTPASLIDYGGFLATGLSGSAVDGARTFLRSRAALFRLTPGEVDDLQLVNNSVLADGGGNAVTFRQQFGTLAATQDGLIIVGISDGRVAYVSSSVTGANATLGAPDATLTAKAAWRAAAQSVGLEHGALGEARGDDGWTVFSAAGLVTPLVGDGKPETRIDQRARLVAFPTYTQGVRPAFETVVLHNQPGEEPAAYVVFVDAVNGNVLFRHNAVDQFSAGSSPGAVMAPHSDFFTGEYALTGDECGPEHPIPVDADNRTLGVTAYPVVAVNDIRLIVRDSGGTSRGESDNTGTGAPEVVVVDLASTGEPGTWTAQVCESAAPVADSVPPTTYVGSYSAVDQDQPSGELFGFPPQWNFFPANPPLPAGANISPPYNYPSTDTRMNACWTTPPRATEPGPCEFDLTPNTGDTNLASRAPWDHNVQPNTPSFQTMGNNAFTAESWFAALTPGPTSQRPLDIDRTYGFLEVADTGSETGALEGWTNAWNETRCDPAALTAVNNNNDVLAATTTLHSGHNMFHDFAYRLGFTERNYNMQVNNFGETAPGPFPTGREDDPEIGNVQNGAALPAELGLTRDIANQITLQDGTPGITNQFLFQPIAGAFYAPCADGDLDAAIYGHEFTHAISNRMVAGPDSGLSGAQAGAMGESWSDQVAVEYLNAYDFVPTSAGENPYAVGIYATGNKQRAIRNYGMNRSPLNYSNIGYDMVCEGPLVGPPVEPACEDPEGQVHADGEIWSATGFEVRQALVQKYNGAFPYGNAVRQKRCADGEVPADLCPGNRRWIQLMFDAFLLQQSDTSMLTARDAYLAADRMRFNGANQQVLWSAFARRGMGSCALSPTAACHTTRSASTNGTDDDNPRPSFESPLQGEKSVTFVAKSAATGQPIEAEIYVGRYEARTTPVADTDAATGLAGVARFVPGTYDILVRADGYGHKRFRLEAAGTTASTLAFTMTPNLASAANGASATGAGANPGDLIDDTEGTTWDVADTGANVDVSRPQVTVNLMGAAAQSVRSVRVSALLDVAEQRFTSLRQFRIQACNAAAPVNADCAGGSGFSTIFTSPANAFAAEAPRPVAPDLLIKSFDVTDTQATHIRLVALDNQCTGAPEFQGDQEDDPTTPSTDCSDTSERAHELHVAELQVLGTGADGAEPPTPDGPRDPVVALTKTGPLTVATGSNVAYEISYTNLGPATASSARVVDTLPAGVSFQSASNGGTYDATTRTVTWNVGNVAAGASGQRTLVVRVPSGTQTGTLLLNQVEFRAPLTTSIPGAFLTAVE